MPAGNATGARNIRIEIEGSGRLPVEQVATMRGFRPRALGEIAIRCADIRAMAAFYGEVLGLEYLAGHHRDGIIFFRLGDGVAGHTSVLALFHHTAERTELHPQGPDAPETGARSSLHHIALSLPYEEQDAVMAWYETKGLDYSVETFDWIGWRGIFTTDPEGNTVELVAKDPNWTGPAD